MVGRGQHLRVRVRREMRATVAAHLQEHVVDVLAGGPVEPTPQVHEPDKVSRVAGERRVGGTNHGFQLVAGDLNRWLEHLPQILVRTAQVAVQATEYDV